MKSLVPAMRIVFGGWMLLSGINHFVVPIYPTPAFHQPLAVQLMDALVHSHLFDVAKAIQLVAGALILAGLFVPVALCVAMPVSVCAAYWAVVLEHGPLVSLLALAALALNGLLMLAYIDYYKGVLDTRWLAKGESAAEGDNYETLYARPMGHITPAQFGGALVPLVAASAFYRFLVPGGTPHFAVVALAFTGLVLLGRLVQGMRSGG